VKKLNNLSDLKKLFPEVEGTFQPVEEIKSIVHKQYLEAHFSNKGRGGKTVTIIKCFKGSPEEFKILAKSLKQYCGVGGSVKDNDIIIQGNMRDKIIIFLTQKGYVVKRIGG
jgi:translation initiation factor 1